MASAERFSLYPASIIHGSAQTMHLTQMSSMSITPNSTRTSIIPAGAVDPAAHLISHADPTIQYVTRDMNTILAQISLSAGLPLTGAATFRLQEREHLGTFTAAATATHETFSVGAGFTFINNISASQDAQEGASANLTMIPLWNGSVDPIVHNTGVAINATAPAFVSQYFLGPVYHNSAALDGVISVSIDTGINFSARRVAGAAYATKGAIVSRNPRIQVTILKADEVAALSVFGRALAGSFAVYLQAGVDSGTRTAAASSAHIKISCATGDWAHDDISANDNEDGTVTLTILPKSTLALATGNAIP